MTCSDLSGPIAAEDIDRFTVDRKRDLAILHRQGLPRLPVLQPSGYHVCHPLRDNRHIQVQLDWIRHPGIAVVDNHQGDIIRGDAQEGIDDIVRPQCYRTTRTLTLHFPCEVLLDHVSIRRSLVPCGTSVWGDCRRQSHAMGNRGAGRGHRLLSIPQARPLCRSRSAVCRAW